MNMTLSVNGKWRGIKEALGLLKRDHRPTDYQQNTSQTLHNVCVYKMQFHLTFQRVSCQTELAYNVARNVGLDALPLFGVTLSRLQEVIELLWVKLLWRHITFFNA